MSVPERLLKQLFNLKSSIGDAEIIIKNLDAYFNEEHITSEIDFVLSLLLKENDSLLEYIDNICSKKNAYNKKMVDQLVPKALDLVLRLIESHIGKVKNYASNIKKLCIYIVQEKATSADCRTKAYSILIALLSAKAKLGSSLLSNSDVKEFVEKLLQELCNASKHTPKVLQKIYELWGVLGEHYASLMSPKAGQILNNIVTKMQTQTKGRETVSMALLTGCLNGLNGLLVNFYPDGGNEFEDIFQRKHTSDIYECITKLCIYDSEHTRRIAHRAALSLLTRHMTLFWHLMFPEYKWWHLTLKQWIMKQGEDRKAGLSVLAKFQQEVARHMSESASTGEENREIFQYFVKYYKDTLEDPSVSSQELTLAIQGFGSLSGACKCLMSSKDVEVMFSLIWQRVQQMFIRTEAENEKLDNLTDFIVALSNIIRDIENMSEGQLESLEQLCIFGIGHFPSLLPQRQPNFIRALKTSIINIALTKGNRLDMFLSTVVYQGVIRTCSHTGSNFDGDNDATFKSYLKLWKCLVDLADDRKFIVKAGASPDLVANITVKVYNVIIETLINLINKLDVSTQEKPQEVSLQENESKSAESDNKIEVTCIGDVMILLNLTNLYSKLLLPALQNIKVWISKLIYDIINKSVSFPTISSFYKLLAVVLKCADQLNYFKSAYADDGEMEWTSHYLVKFIQDVLVKLRQYKGDLQVCCLEAVMATPVVVLEPLLELIAPTLQVVFNVGRSYLELAHRGMDALERWQKELSSERLNLILRDILPSFDPFLRSKVYFGDAVDIENIHVPKSQMRRQKRVAEESELTRLQKRMLKLLSHLNTPTSLALLEQEDMSAVAWSWDKFLQVAIPFPDVRPEIYLDDFLPRVVELALSSERATRSAAGELLHAIIMVILKKGQEVEKCSDKSLIQILKHIAPTLLQLGSHADSLTSQLFRPLVIQITHWLSSKWMLKSPQTSVFLEAIWDGLTHPTDTGVRYFSAACIKEFVTWSIKQLTEFDLEQHPLNVKAVVRQMNTYCLHPSPYKRLGAALAFNNLYKILREHSSLIDIFWIELFYHFLRNLALSRTEDTQQVVQALDHLERVLYEKSNQFNKESKGRRVPVELKGPLLKDLVNWLIEQCASTQEIYRKKCMHFVQSLTCGVPEYKKVSELLEDSHMKNGEFSAGLGNHFLKPAPSTGLGTTIALVIAWLKQLCSSLSCYSWMVGQGFRPSENLLAPGKSSFFDATKFLLSINMSSATPVMEELRGELYQDIALSAQEEMDFNVVKCRALLELFQFVGTEECIRDLPEEFWSAHWWKAVSSCVLTPTKSGFGVTNQDLARKLPDIMHQLLTTLSSYLQPAQLHDLYTFLDNTYNNNCQFVCSDLRAIFRGQLNIKAEMKNQLEGLVFLHQCNIYPHLQMASSWSGETILKTVANEIIDSSGRPVETIPAAINYARSMLSFAFLLLKDVTLTLNCVLDTTPLSNSTITRGEYFTGLFKSQLLDHLIEDPLLQCVDHLLSEVNLYKMDLIRLLVKHCEYNPSTTNRPGKDLAAKLSSRWHQLERWAEGDLTLQHNVLDIAIGISKCFRNPNSCFKSSDLRAIGNWVLSQIAASEARLPLRLKIDVLKLLPCVTQQDVTNVALLDSLNTLRSNHFPVRFNEFVEGSVEAGMYKNAFQQLLNALVISGNIDILETIVSETRSDENHPCKEAIDNSLSTFIKKLALQQQTRALDKVFSMFEDNRHSTERLVVLYTFMIPLLKCALPVVQVTFLAQNISWALSVLKEGLEKRDLPKAKGQLQFKIGAFSLIETMFGTLDIKEYIDVNATIVKASGIVGEKMFSKELLRIARNVRTTETLFTETCYKELFRLYHCAAYKAVISILTNCECPNLNDFYRAFIFEETSSHKIWSHIVSTDTEFSFPIDFAELPKRKKQLVAIKTKILNEHKTDRSNMSLMASQSLFSSTLSEDIIKYDFTAYNVRTYHEAAIAMEAEELRKNIAVELDVDILNEHECMPTLCGLISHIMHSDQNLSQDIDQNLKMPPWMECLRKSLESAAQHKNVKVFILKLILNCEQFFCPYAKFWLSPIIQCILNQCLGDSINYMTADIIEMLTKWHEGTRPDINEYEKTQLTNLLEFLIERCATADRKDIFKYKLNLVSLVLIAWKPEVPYNLLLHITSDQTNQHSVQVGLTVAATLLSYDCLPFQDTGKKRYYEALRVSFLNSDRTVYLLSADVIGRIFKKLDSNCSEDFSDEDREFYTNIYDILKRDVGSSNSLNCMNRFVLCLHALQKYYPPVAIRFISNSKDLINKLPSNMRVLLLEVLFTALDTISWETNPYQDFVVSVFSKFLKTNHANTQELTLKIINKMLPMLSDFEAETILKEVVALCEHSEIGCREAMYDIVANYFNRRIAQGDRTSHMVGMCKAILIRGLVDNNEKLQNKIFQFWNEEERLSKTTGNRFVDVLSKLYSPKEEYHFLTSAVCLLLESAAVNPYCKETKVFSNPLTACTYEEYKVTTNWRAQHASLAPMFAQTFSSDTATFTQSEHSFNIRATPTSFVFEPTSKSAEEKMDTSSFSFAMPSTSMTFIASGSSQSNPGSSAGVFAEPQRKRFKRNKDEISRFHANRNLEQNVKREKIMSERRKKRDAHVNIIRNYRIGDFPDVEIKYTDLVKPLQHLVKRDLVIARQVFLSLYTGLKAQSTNLPHFPSAVDNILETTTQYEPSTMATMLDVVLLQPDQFSLNIDTIAKVCKNSKLLSVGAMVMEHLLLVSDIQPPPSKKSRPAPTEERKNNLWIQLAEMYRCMGEADVVKGIFEEKMASSCSKLVQEALQDEGIGYWKGAQEKYMAAIEQAGNAVMQDFLYEACFKCCEYMSDWKALNSAVRHQVGNNLNEIWFDPWTLDHYLPVLIASEVNEAMIEDSVPTEFLQTVHNWMSDPVKEDYLKNRLSEPLCMVYLLRGDTERSKLYSENNLSQFIDSWAQLDVLQRKLRGQKLLQLKTMMEIHHYTSLPSDPSNWKSRVKELLNYWKNNSPSTQDSLNNWETRALYRHFFASKLQSKMDTETKAFLKDAQFCSQISFLNCALQQGNYYTARKYIGFTHAQIIKNEEDEEKKKIFLLCCNKVKFLRTQMDPANVSAFESTIEVARELLHENSSSEIKSLSPTLQIKLHNQMATLCSSMESLVQKDPTLLTQLNHDPVRNFNVFIGLQDIRSAEEVISCLHNKTLSNLQKAVEIAEEITTDGSSSSLLAETYFELAKYASQGEGDAVEAVMIEALLKAMKFGSAAARQLFPNLLQVPSLSTTNAQLFIDQSNQVAEWMFLQWLPQLLSSLDSKWKILISLLERIAQAYPVALQFPFQLSCEMYQNSPNKPLQEIISRLGRLLIQSPVLTALVSALTCLHYRPATILYYHLEKLKQDIENNVNEQTTYKILKKESFLSVQDVYKVKGPLFKNNTKYEERIEDAVAAMKNNKENAMVELKKIMEDVAKEIPVSKNFVPETLLKSYSPFLESFNQDRHGDIEIPGQYTGHSRPIPEQHVMIAGFKNKVEVIPSLRRPIRITILGNDAKERNYLVKFGEDLRQDQRIQQLFGVMNQILASDPVAASKGLSVDTYNVVPLNNRSGLIAWVYDTIPLKKFIMIDKSVKEKYAQASEEFMKWIRYSKGDSCEHVYGIVFSTYTRKETIENFRRIENILPSDLLRKALHKIASSSEAYMYLRTQMLTSHAVLCVCHWLLGIGDRHLNNILVSTKTGRLLGIDFGHAFDTAVGLPAPELMPCRMTPQFENLAAPLYLKGTVQETMVHTLQALRNNHKILLNTMCVFIQEPAINWVVNMQKYKQHSDEENWYPHEKINLARRKLQGDHPSWILCAELAASQRHHQYLEHLIELVKGNKEYNVRASLPEYSLTVREQVQCLLDQATDRNILGKTYVGWEPYV